MNPIFMVVGPPAVGKSTTSRALAARFPKSIHIPVDDIRHMVVSGLVLPSLVWGDDLVQQFSLARANVVRMAVDYRSADFAVIIDDIWDYNHGVDYQTLFSQPNMYKIILYPDQDEAHQRNLKRSGDSPARPYIDEGIREMYQQLNPVVPQLEQEGWMVVDTTTLSVEAVVTTILQLTAVER
jgi:hypothetical protein